MMVATSRFYACFIVALSTGAAAVTFAYRFYDNEPCDHSSPPSDTFPLNSLPALLGSSGECLNAPPGVNWTTVELNNSLSDGLSSLTVFCGADCGGDAAGGENNTNCYRPGPGCNIGSFLVLSNDTGAAQPLPSSTGTVAEPPSTATVAASESATAVTTSVLQAAPSIQPQVDLVHQKAPDVWKFVGAISLGFTVVCLLILTTYYLRRRRNAKARLITPSGPSTSITPYTFSYQSNTAKPRNKMSPMTSSTTVDCGDAALANQTNEAPFDNVTGRLGNAPLTREVTRTDTGARVGSDRRGCAEALISPPVYQFKAPGQ